MALDDDIRQFTEIAIFRHLETDALRLLAFAAETKLLRAGDVLFRAGDPADGAYFLASGAASLAQGDGLEVFPVAPPALLGELALLTETERRATATATAPSTVRHITRTLFRRVLDESPQGAVKIRAMLLGRLGDYTGELDRYAQDRHAQDQHAQDRRGGLAGDERA